jgi:hypothetical protein
LGPHVAPVKAYCERQKLAAWSLALFSCKSVLRKRY